MTTLPAATARSRTQQPLMTHLVERYRRHLKQLRESADNGAAGSRPAAKAGKALDDARTFDGFVAFCHDQLTRDNPPTNVTFTDGISLILADGSRVDLGGRRTSKQWDGRKVSDVNPMGRGAVPVTEGDYGAEPGRLPAPLIDAGGQ